MSYILEALKRSERERQTGQVPTLPNVLSEPPGRRRSWLAWLVVGLLLLNAVGLGYGLLRDRAGHPVPSQATAPVAPPPIAPVAVMPVRVAPDASAADRDVVPTTVLAPQPPLPPVAARGEPPAILKPSAVPRIEPKSAAVAKPKPIPKRSTVPPARQEAAADRDAEEVSEIPTAPKPAVPPQPGRLAAFHPPQPLVPPGEVEANEDEPGGGSRDIPLLRTMDPDFRQRMPAFTINIYAYSSDPAERFAIIDMKKYRVGDEIPGGAQLLEIRADSLVLILDGTKFRVPRP